MVNVMYRLPFLTSVFSTHFPSDITKYTNVLMARNRKRTRPTGPDKYYEREEQVKTTTGVMMRLPCHGNLMR